MVIKKLNFDCKINILWVLIFYWAGEAKLHIGNILSIVCPSFCHALLLLVPHAFRRTLVTDFTCSFDVLRAKYRTSQSLPYTCIDLFAV